MTRRVAITAAIVFTIVAAIYLLRLDSYAGLMIDDAWYMVLAKSLAEGEGFRLISASATPIVPVVPPAFPALLSIVFLISPAYPGNLMLLKGVSLIAMAGIGVACWFDFTRHRQVPPAEAVWLVAATLLVPAFVFLATSTVMAEAWFTLAQLLTVIAVERAVRGADHARAPIAAGFMAAFTMLIRTAGLAVVASGLAYFVWRRRWKQAAIFAAVTAVLMAPWQIYASVNASPFSERVVHGGTIAYTYYELLAMERPGLITTSLSPAARITRAARNIQDMLMLDVGAVLVPGLYRGPLESGEEVIAVGRPGRGSMGGATGTMIVSSILVLVMIAGIVRARAWFSLPVILIGTSLVMISSVGSQTIRYVIPLAPFLLLYLWRGIKHPSAARIAVLCVLMAQLVDHALYVRLKMAGNPVWIAGGQEIDEVITFVSTNIPGDAVIASSNPGLLYLRTGHKGLVSVRAEQNIQIWRELGVRYIAALRLDELPARRLYKRVLFQTGSRLWVVEM
ncbi:MAG: hypothetical protein K2Y23_07485 [Cyanobacteria bacterium]|nr:hypothetical protein [Cyanobacteriota bacterium]